MIKRAKRIKQKSRVCLWSCLMTNAHSIQSPKCVSCKFSKLLSSPFSDTSQARTQPHTHMHTLPHIYTTTHMHSNMHIKPHTHTQTHTCSHRHTHIITRAYTPTPEWSYVTTFHFVHIVNYTTFKRHLNAFRDVI